jgi:glycerate kinase
LLEGCPIVIPRTAMPAPIPRAALLAGGPFRPRLDADGALAEIAGGLAEAGAPAPDVCPLPASRTSDRDTVLRALSDARFDERMRAARALVVCERSLIPSTLASTVAFELATRARQAGVPAFAVCAEDQLSAFDERLIDLQEIITARGRRGLRAAGRRLAVLVAPPGAWPAANGPHRPRTGLTAGSRGTRT